MMHKKSSSHVPLLKLPKGASSSRWSRLDILLKTYSPNPPLSHTARLIAEKNLNEALANLVESVKVKQENMNMVFSHLFLFILHDEETDPSLKKIDKSVPLTEEALQLHQRMHNGGENDEPEIGGGPGKRPKSLHSAMLHISSLGKEYINSKLALFLTYYTEAARAVEITRDIPAFSSTQYFQLRLKILSHSLESAIQVSDKAFIGFLIEFESEHLNVTPKICRALFNLQCFNALWRYSRIDRLAELAVALDQRKLAQFQKNERSTTAAPNEHMFDGDSEETANFKTYLDALIVERSHCEYLKREYSIHQPPKYELKDIVNEKVVAATVNSETRNNLPRQLTHVSTRIRKQTKDQIGEEEREEEGTLKSDTAKDLQEHSLPQMVESEDQKEEENERQAISVMESGVVEVFDPLQFEFSHMAKFIHYLLQMENFLESEPLVANSKIVQFLRHIKVYYGMEDESVIRVLLLLGYENEALYLVLTENYTVSSEVFITSIESQAYILALLMEGGCKYIKQCLEEHKVWIYEKSSRSKFLSYDYQHPMNGYSISLFEVKDQFNGALLRKLKTRPQYLEIFLFIWRRNIELIDQNTAQEILEEIEAQIDFAVSNNRSDGGFLRFVSNPLKVCVLEIEFVMALKEKFSHIFSKSISVLESLKGIAFNIQEQIRLDESSLSEDTMRYILEDQDFSHRSLLTIISDNKFLLELLAQPMIYQMASETWEGPYRMDKSFIPRLSVNRELLSRFFTDKQGEERPIPIALKCKAKRCCFRRERERMNYQNYSLESEEEQVEPTTRRERRTCCKWDETSFELGFSYVNNDLAKNSRQYETIPMYQFECWKEGQQLRFYESYVFEYIIFGFQMVFLFTIRSQYLALDLANLTPAEGLSKMQDLDKTMRNSVYMSFVFYGVPLHYLMLLCYYKLNRVKGKALFNAQSLLDIFVFLLVGICSATILPSFFQTSNQIRDLDASSALLSLELAQLKSDLKNSNIWIFLSLFTGMMWLHVALSFRVSKSLGPLYKVLRLNFYDFMIWMTMIIITLSMFSVAGIMLSVDVTTHPCSGFKPCIIMYFEASMGSISFSEQVGVVAAQGLLIVCIIINLVLLFTVLIAMLTDSYEKIVSKAQLYFIKDIFEIARARKLDDRFGAFMSLDFPFTLFPGSLILTILHCKYRSYLKESNEEMRRAKLESIQNYNNLYLKFPAFALAWVIISAGIFAVNIITIPLVWLLVVYNEIKVLSNPDLVDMSQRQHTSLGVEYEELTPTIFERHKNTGDDHTERPKVKKNSRVKRFFSVSLWIFIFGILIVAFSTLIDTIKFCASFWYSQKTTLANLQRAHKNESITFDRHQRTFRLNMRPRSVSSLATLAYEQLYENYERRKKKERKEDERAEKKRARAVGEGERTIQLMRAQSFWRKQKHEIQTTPNTMKLAEFATKLEKELNLKGYLKERNPSTLQPDKQKRDPFYLRANSIIPKSYQNESGQSELSEREVFRRLLLNFSVKRSKYGNLNENLLTHQEIDMETEEIFKKEDSLKNKSGRYLYLDCLVGIYSNLLILSKLEEFTKHPSNIPPSVRLNALDTLDRQFSEVHTLRAQDQDLQIPQRINEKSKFKDAEESPRIDKTLKRLPTAVRLEEGSYIKFYQIEGIFFAYRLQRLISALCTFYSESYRKKYTLGEIKKCSNYIAKVRKRKFKEENKTYERLQTFQRAMTMSSSPSVERRYSVTRSPGTLSSMPRNKNFHLIPQEAEEDEKSEGSYQVKDLQDAYEEAMSPRTLSPEPREKYSTKTAIIQTHRLLSDTKLTLEGLQEKAHGKIAWDETVRGKVQEPISDSKEELEFMIKR